MRVSVGGLYSACSFVLSDGSGGIFRVYPEKYGDFEGVSFRQME